MKCSDEIESISFCHAKYFALQLIASRSLIVAFAYHTTDHFFGNGFGF